MDDRTFVRRVLIVLLLAGIAAALIMAAQVLLLLFGSVLIAVLLRGLARQVKKLVRMPDAAAVGIVVLVLAGVTGLFFLVLGQQVSSQFSSLAKTLPASVDRISESLEQTAWGRQVLDRIGQFAPLPGDDNSPPAQQPAPPGGQQPPAPPTAPAPPPDQGGGGLDQQRVGQIVGILGRAVMTVVNALGDLALVLVGGIYLAFQPSLYRHGIESLVPKDMTGELRTLLDRSGRALWLWALGQSLGMIAIGLLTTLGLWALGVPVPLALGLIAGILEFIPIVGPILAAIPAVLLAFLQGPEVALYTVLFYLALQQVEGNLLMPIIQNKAVSLPPVVTLFALLVFGTLLGSTGVIFATPLAVLLMVWVQQAYVRDTLGKRVEVTGAPKKNGSPEGDP
ncbi:AI-2E family transporter [Aerophototrophica crusticola]|uniref:AI-2E family transporter n=1 Tax=Aerophototrophica crusticola TaxID=1709002 RepID=A0A858R731_9PROT|nr:AI-2E family transporter [Rhodospirillaceae bacterium B3]